ncbi:MAG: HAD hydrolase-like protein [Selenomonas sp.]|nr:HAD hydrolase-like protein [Selenomonas sp.]
MGYKLIIFDLDGTLMDTSQGIFNSVRYAEEKMGLEPTAEKNLRKFVGPPPTEMYKKLYGLNDEQSLEAAGYHREYGRSKAIYEARLYDGVPETLARLSEQGCILAVATLKRQDIAEKILSLYGIGGYFAHIAGMNQAESDTKAGLIKNLCALENIIPGDEVMMVGDSQYDYEGAKEAGVEFLGVSYGYGFDGTEKRIKFVSCFREIKTLVACFFK